MSDRLVLCGDDEKVVLDSVHHHAPGVHPVLFVGLPFKSIDESAIRAH